MDKKKIIQLLISPLDADFELGRELYNYNYTLSYLFLLELDSQNSPWYFVGNDKRLMWRFKNPEGKISSWTNEILKREESRLKADRIYL